MMRTANPALSAKTFLNLPAIRSEKMTITGVAHKSLALISLVILSALWSWGSVMQTNANGVLQPVIPGWYWIVILASFVLGIIIIFNKTTAPYLAPAYALGEGLLLGMISALYELQFQGIVLQAVLLTTGVFVSLLLAYQSRLIPVTENFRLGVVAATGAIAIVYLISLVAGFFGVTIPYLHDSSPMGIAISVVIVVIAALNLVLDFDFIEKGAEAGAPKYMEWYAAFGLLVTLVWLYIEILRLLAKTKRR